MFKRFILVLVVACVWGYPISAIAESAEVTCLREQIAMYGRHAQESREAARYTKSIEGNFDLLCKYGKTTGMDLYRAQIAEQAGRRNTVCWSDINVNTLAGIRANFERHKKAVASDCAKAAAAKK